MPVTANFPNLGGIQSLDSTGMTNNPNMANCAVDWDGARAFLYSTGGHQFEVVNITTCAVTVAPVASALFDGGMFYGKNGSVYGIVGATNNATLNKVNPAAGGATTATFGVSGGPFGFTTDATHWAYPADWDVVIANGTHFVISSCLNANQSNNEVTFLNIDAMSWAGSNYHPDEPVCKVTHGLASGLRGTAYAMGTKAVGSVFGFYSFLIDAVGVSSMVSVSKTAAAGINAAWTHLSGVTGLLLDETDGNVLAHVTTNPLAAWNIANTYFTGDGVRNAGHDFLALAGSTGIAPTVGGNASWADLGAQYPAVFAENRIVKVNVSTGAVMWSVLLNADMPNAGGGITAQSRVQDGLYLFFDNASNGAGGRWMHQILTSTGTDVKVAVINTIPDDQWSNSVTGQVIFNGSWAATAGAPVAVGHGVTGNINTLGRVTPPFQPASAPPSAKRHHNQILDYFTTPATHL